MPAANIAKEGSERTWAGRRRNVPSRRVPDTAIWLATLPDGGPTGGFFRDREKIPW
ncbi:MAG: hypothetical protein WBA34_09085 [Candidatus Deferrimicrobiaceae bacterium]